MGLVAATIGLDISNNGIKGINTILAVESLFVAFNYVIPFLIWEQLEKALAKSKSMLWFKVFKVYLIVQAAFWVYAAYRCFTKDTVKRFD